ncbi:hypothetical protein LTR85_010899 [Meristemomyces frigidus]|nr:hypothetical protein LTR85_010899 [Meristemomyces frigidus]
MQGALAIALSLLSATNASPVERAAAPSVVVDAGTVIGTVTTLPSASVAVSKYLGIPYATPTLRFKPAATVTQFAAPVQATAFGPACIQQIANADESFVVDTYLGSVPPQSEDCLSLNVWVPAGGAAKKTVMFYIHGGFLEFGASREEFLDGTSFAANQDVIIVSINYRLSVLGFADSPELPLAQRNLGYLDQRNALGWVQRNIAAFGGDPTKVTIFGQSSGAASVDRLYLTEKVNPPFRAAILQSGQATVSPLDGINNFPELAATVGCATLACVQALPISVIQNAINSSVLLFTPINDGVTQLATPLIAYRDLGKASNLPYMIGSAGQEGTVFTAQALSLLVNYTQASAFLNATSAGASPFVTEILNEFIGVGDDVFLALSQVLTYYINQCPASIAALASVNAGVPTWRYYFNASFPNTQPPIVGLPNLYAYHTSDIPIIWGTYPAAGATTQEIQLSKFMQTAWANFAKNPTTTGPGWGKYNALGANVACIGCQGSSGQSPILAATIDGPCAILDAAYALFTSVPF